ncbi:hypothetical protein EW026_g4299 [Hermanssonia centrifuga]|uniref:Uncharacterized protein n=1 Tax=Hermanssonia centrifuga TaxID=98765 RepID=A0A4S4KHK7_9APHY|nr:hypothetical protein EW026_g4299 [Hermanssonia centrifuga]
MAYYDQYRSGEQQPTYPPQQYPDPAEAAYNPYDNPQPHQTYEQAGYGYQEPGYGGYRDEPALPAVATEEKRERSGFENEGVNNPNIFSVKFDSINAKIFYPLNNNSTDIGGGTLNNLVIQDNKQTNFTLPFNLNYTEAIDPNNAILLDIVQRCFVDTSNEITVNYEIDLSFKVLFIPIKPTIKNSASFKCPISANDIADLLKSAGINIPDLSTLLSALL